MRAVLILCLMMMSFGVASARTPEPAIAFAGFVAADPTRTRISLDFDKVVEAETRFSAEPLRLVIDLPPTAFRLGKPLSLEASDAIARISFDQSQASRSRIIVDLDARVRVVRQSVVKDGEGDGSTLILDLVPASDEEFARLVRDEPIEAPEVVATDRSETRDRPLILLDPGHGGVDGGAVGRRRTVEKVVVLAFAKVFRDALLATGRFDVALTREADKFVSLQARVKQARRERAALLISIHADSLSQRRIRGATVYTLSDRASDEVAAELATDQNRADLAAGMTVPKLDPGAADILLDLMQRETDDTSVAVAGRVVKALGTATRLIGNPNRSADFFVLRSPDVPSILLELGYLSNTADEKLLASTVWQKKVAAALTNGLLAHFHATGPIASEIRGSR